MRLIIRIPRIRLTVRLALSTLLETHLQRLPVELCRRSVQATILVLARISIFLRDNDSTLQRLKLDEQKV